MKVYEAIASAIIAEGCTSIFGLVGDANLFIWAALERDPNVRIYSARHEAAAVSMADGYSKATGQLTVATVTRGPGLTHTSTALIQAARARTPLVLVVGDVPAGAKHNSQYVDQRRFAEACECRFQPVTKADSVAEEVRDAFFTARAHRCPVVLSIATDIQEHEFKWDWDYTPSTAYMPQIVGAPSAAGTETLVEMLVRAERPVIIAGRGAWAARDEIVALADRSGALLATSLLGKGMFAGHPYDVGIAGAFASAPTEQLLADADVVISLGAELGYHTSEGGLLFPSAEVARVDIRSAPDDISMLPGKWIQGEAKATAAAVTEALEARQIRKTGYRNGDTQAVLEAKPEPHDKATDGLDPRLLAQSLAGVLPQGTQVTVGVGHYWSFPAMYLPLPEGGRMHFSHQFGCIGSGLPTGIGVAVATSDRPNVLIEGDGSILQHLQELESVVREGLQLVVIVWNDAGYGAEVHKINAKKLDSNTARWKSPDFVALAKAFGGDGVLLKNESDVADAVRTGIRQGGLYLIDARVSPTTFSDPYGKIHFGLENKAPLLRRPAA